MTIALVLASACAGEAERTPAPAAASSPAAAVPAPERPVRAPEPPGDAPRARERRGDRHARAQARRVPMVKRADGIVTRASDRLVVIRSGARRQAPLTLRVTPGTTVTVNGVPSRAGALAPGVEVRAAYRSGDGGRPTALSIDAGPAAVR